MLTKPVNNTPKIIAIQWVLASGVGWIVGHWIAGCVASSLLSSVPSPVNPHSLGGLLISNTSFAIVSGIFVGALVGILQWVVAKRYVNLSAFWIVTNILSWSIAEILGSWMETVIFHIPSVSLVAEGVPALARYASLGLCCGISLGILQRPIVKNNLGNCMPWLWISIASWSIPFIIYIGFMYFAFLFPRNHAVDYYLSVQYRSLGNLLNLIYSLTHNSIGFMAGVITILMLDYNYKEFAKHKSTEG
jgi:hypothetical protein